MSWRRVRRDRWRQPTRWAVLVRWLAVPYSPDPAPQAQLSSCQLVSVRVLQEPACTRPPRHSSRCRCCRRCSSSSCRCCPFTASAYSLYCAGMIPRNRNHQAATGSAPATVHPVLPPLTAHTPATKAPPVPRMVQGWHHAGLEAHTSGSISCCCCCCCCGCCCCCCCGCGCCTWPGGPCGGHAAREGIASAGACKGSGQLRVGSAVGARNGSTPLAANSSAHTWPPPPAWALQRSA